MCIIAAMGEVTQADGRPASATESERVELKELLSSQTFMRSQRLAKLLEYISEKHFRGQDDEVCEYSIATEVLGRHADFDPAEDAIARVEIHRLRKKLRDYYATDGANRPLKIVLPPGMYTPVFLKDAHSPGVTGDLLSGDVPGPTAKTEPPAPPPKEPEPQKLAPLAAAPNNRKLWLFALAALPLIAVVAVMTTVRRPGARAQAVLPALRAEMSVLPGSENAVRIIAGFDRPQYIDHHGHTWLADRYFEGGGKPGAPFRQFIARTSDPLLYQNGRIGLMAYHIPLKPGNYELKLHFVEPIYGPGLETGGGENSRVFDVMANGKTLMESFDIVSDAGGPQIADVRVFKDIQPGQDGILHLAFHARREQPLINAIEVEPAPLHKINPIRIVTQPNSVTDSQGQVWGADNYFMGGQSSNHWKAVTGTPDADLYFNERYGHFSYAIPVAAGSYGVTLHFAETYWGPENQGGGGPGRRVFDVYCNGTALLRDFDILQETGCNRALVKRFHGLRPNALGKLDLEFMPKVNYASVFAIEVLDEGR